MDASAIKDLVMQWIVANNFCYSQFPSGDFVCSHTSQQTGFQITFGNFTPTGFIVFASTGKLIPKNNRNEAYRYACKINFFRLGSTLEIDPFDGEWRVRVYIPLNGTTEIPPGLIDWAFKLVREEVMEHARRLDQEGCLHNEQSNDADDLPVPEERLLEAETSSEPSWEIQDEELRRILDGE